MGKLSGGTLEQEYDIRLFLVLVKGRNILYLSGRIAYSHFCTGRIIEILNVQFKDKKEFGTFYLFTFLGRRK